MCGVIITLSTFSALPDRVDIGAIRGRILEQWPPSTFAGWRIKDDGKLVVPIDANGVAVPLNSTYSRIWKKRTRHPMYDLIQDAEVKWKRMLQR